MPATSCKGRRLLCCLTCCLISPPTAVQALINYCTPCFEVIYYSLLPGTSHLLVLQAYMHIKFCVSSRRPLICSHRPSSGAYLLVFTAISFGLPVPDDNKLALSNQFKVGCHLQNGYSRSPRFHLPSWHETQCRVQSLRFISVPTRVTDREIHP